LALSADFRFPRRGLKPFSITEAVARCGSHATACGPALLAFGDGQVPVIARAEVDDVVQS
jgi:hypothetical protein